jgi:sugar lactone lactonase YvrE
MFFSLCRAPRPGPRRLSYRPRVEPLETRLVPAVFTVVNTADAGPGSLRQAIVDADGTPEANTIAFASGVQGAIDLTSPLPDLSGSVDVEGPHAGLVVRRSPAPGTAPFRIFSVARGAIVTLARLTIAGGVSSGNLFVGDRPGISSSIVRVDPTTGAQALVTPTAATQFGQLFGIALDPAGAIFAVGSGAFPGGVVRVDPATGAVTPLSLNGHFTTPDAIATDAAGTIFVSDATGLVVRVDPVTGAQTVVSSSGASFNPVSIAVGPAGTLFVTNGQIFSLGVIRVDPVTGAQTPVSLGGSFTNPRAIAVARNGDIFVADATAFGGTGGILRVDPATGAQTRVASGGNLLHPTGIALDAAGNLLVADADAFGGAGGLIRVDPVSGAQSVVSSGGRLQNAGSVAVGGAAGGGGILNAGTLTLVDSTVAGNTSGRGGGIDNEGTLTIRNSTVAGNSAGGPGGGVFNAGVLAVSDSTIADNAAGAGGGVFTSGPAEIYSTIVARNQALSGPDVAGPFRSRGHNLIGDGTGGSGFAATDLVGTAASPIDPRLGPLQANGGPTPTLALLPGSPAIDAGDPADFPARDQRGLPRAADGNGDGQALPDIGAFEAGARGPAGNGPFVSQLYRDLLGREPDPGGLALWAGLLDRGNANRYQVAWAIDNSPEHHLVEVGELYRRLLRREADPAGLVLWAQFLDRGGTAESLEAWLLGSAEYLTRIAGGTASGFVDALYHDVLHRSPEPGAVEAWGRLLVQEASPTAIAAAILNSLESDTDEVQGLYQRFLGRAADPVGLLALTEALQRGVPNEVGVMLLLGSPEYFEKAA